MTNQFRSDPSAGRIPPEAAAFSAGGLPPRDLQEVASRGGGVLVLLTDDPADRVLPMIRASGREHDVRVLDFTAAGSAVSTHAFNPFAPTTAATTRISAILASHLSDAQPDGATPVFRNRALGLANAVAPVLAWLQEHRGVGIDFVTLHRALELEWLWSIATRAVALVRDPISGTETELDLADALPQEVAWPLLAYLDELPGYNPSLSLEVLTNSAAGVHHGYAQFYFTAGRVRLAATCSHVFAHSPTALNAHEVARDRRVLVVRLPAWEGSDDTLALLGRVFIASFDVTRAEMLGEHPEPTLDPDDTDTASRFPVFLGSDVARVLERSTRSPLLGFHALV